jgi:hypothetical protein
LNDRTEIEHFREGLVVNAYDLLRTKLVEKCRGKFGLRRTLDNLGGIPNVARECAIKLIDSVYEVTFRRSTLGVGFAIPFITSFCSHVEITPTSKPMAY